MAHHRFQAGDLTAIIGDNAAHGQHRAGYNGLWSLQHRTGSRSLFVPGVAGLNLEHIISGKGEADRDVFFEPRRSPMELRQVSDAEAELYQPPARFTHLESWTTFTLRPPHIIDMSFRCRATQHSFPYGYIGLFWASYINAPLDKSMYFRGGLEGGTRTGWSQLCTPAHNAQSTVRGRMDRLQMEFPPGSPNALYKNFSPLRYDLPFFYGNFENHTFLVMFDRGDGIRLTHSPSGGGWNSALETTNPAWDFQFLVANYEVNVEYHVGARILFCERISREQILAEVEKWVSER